VKEADGIVEDSKEQPRQVEAQMKQNYYFGPTAKTKKIELKAFSSITSHKFRKKFNRIPTQLLSFEIAQGLFINFENLIFIKRIHCIL
jgi:hypothetical protein